ncbi:MAG: alkaline phosphatase family protein, partial [Tunicatimonas sp.]
LREQGYITVKNELGHELLDAGVSRAFAVADHQLAHVYVNEAEAIPKVKALLEGTPGIAYVLDEAGKKQHHLNHERAGELVAVAEPDAWFTYYYWLDDAKAPDFARTVDIHRKPGYDPVEVFADPDIRFLKAKIGTTLLKKKLGFRYLMDVIPLDATLVKGSHGGIDTTPEDRPLLVSQHADLLPDTAIAPTSVIDVILAHLTVEDLEKAKQG